MTAPGKYAIDLAMENIRLELNYRCKEIHSTKNPSSKEDIRYKNWNK